jgi:hypothetical protein
MDLIAFLLPAAAMGAEHKISGCAGSSFRHLQPGPVVVIVPRDSGSVTAELLQELHAFGQWPVFTISVDRVAQLSSEKASSFVLPPVSNQAELRRILRELAAWNSRARFVILTPDETMSLLILNELRDLNLVNAVVLTLIPNIASVKAYTWFPYLPPGQCDKENIFPVFLDECLIANSPKFARNVTLFPQKVPLDLYGCPITLSTFPWPPFIINPQVSEAPDKVFYTEGLEIKLVNTIAQKMNSTVQYLPPPANDSKWGNLIPSGLSTGLLGEVFYRRADAAFASMTATKDRIQYLDTTVTYWSNSVAWIVPRPKFISGWRSLLGIFKPTLWGTVILTYLLGSASLCILSHMVLHPREPALYRSPGSCMMATWALSLEIGAHLQPRGVATRLVFTCWAIYCLQISTAYKSSLISVLTNPQQEPAILNMEQLAKSTLNLEYTVGLSEYFDDSVDVTTQRLRKSLQFCANVTVCLNKVALEGDTALVNDRWYVEYLIPQLYLDSSGQPLLQILPQDVLSYHVVMMVSKGNVLLDRFNMLISRVVESGFMIKWAKDIKHARPFGAVSQEAVRGRRLSLSHLESLFVFLLLGECLALVTFIIEVVIAKKF